MNNKNEPVNANKADNHFTQAYRNDLENLVRKAFKDILDSVDGDRSAAVEKAYKLIMWCAASEISHSSGEDGAGGPVLMVRGDFIEIKHYLKK